MMANTVKSKGTGEANGRIWGLRAADWATIQEPQCAPAYHSVFEKGEVGAGTRLLNAGCGAGMALMFAAQLGAEVSGFDASDALLDIARDRLPDASFAQLILRNCPLTTTPLMS
jgi:cyclopropane fatty-acyl-phospholipid synthase-like methyltransferase